MLADCEIPATGSHADLSGNVFRDDIIRSWKLRNLRHGGAIFFSVEVTFWGVSRLR